MKQRILLPFLTAILSTTTLMAEPKANAPSSTPPDWAAPAKTPGTVEFSGDDLAAVLRGLASRAKINILVSTAVKGTVTIRLENVTAIQAIRIICEAQQIVLFESHAGDGTGSEPVFIVMTAAERVTSLHYLDSTVLPEALAKFKKRYFDALIKAGFSRDEALKIAANETLPLDKLELHGK